MTSIRLPWRRALSPALTGTLALPRLMPRLSLTRTILLTLGTVVVAVLSIAVTVAFGRLLGVTSVAVRNGPDSPAAHADGWPLVEDDSRSVGYYLTNKPVRW
jgi:hypothetical protein